MEPVPETERMEEFRPSPLPSLRLPATTIFGASEPDFLRKPPTIRRSTDPSPSSPISPSWQPPTLPYRPRASSPLSSNHVRSRSAASLAPPMTRTQSMPGTSTTGHLLYSPHIRPQSPSGSPGRIRLPRKPADEAFPSSPTRVSVLDHERKLPERNTSPNRAMGTSQTTSTAMPKLRRPAYGYPAAAAAYLSSSSVPSTPTSARSRSPSISSLETIPDSPDAEEAALEAERIAQLKAAADAAEGGDAKGRSSVDVPARGRTLSGFGSRDKRKRWSVCGAERRQDLDLETIWED
ncbi:hypothetical protein N658DRAFT_433796 [Parathielavia hyrcaniae]|uniref:Basic proline-rich protein n=1 Tax=Parathielavia hyrcaniae TaxID=113614 RepID=A0AAN6PWU0_9PEZI|nr:hypothetical protein N658DRAFT_433796 [Parathielavia hyrcaniae]